MGKKEAVAQLQQRGMDVLRKYVKANKSALPDQIVFAGSSLMEMFPIEKMQQTLELKQKIYNRGVSGTTTQFLLQHIGELVLDLQPAKIFINIGSNDIDFGDFNVGDPDNDFLCLLDCSTDDFGKEFGRKVLKYYQHKAPEVAERKAELNDVYWSIDQIIYGYERKDREMLIKGVSELLQTQAEMFIF